MVNRTGASDCLGQFLDGAMDRQAGSLVFLFGHVRQFFLHGHSALSVDCIPKSARVAAKT